MMNDKIEKLKQKLKNPPAKDLDSVLSQLKESIFEEARKSFEPEIVKKVSDLTNEVKGLLANQSDGMQSLIAYLEQKQNELNAKENDTKDIYVQVVMGLKHLAQQLDKTQKVNVMNMYRRQSITKAEMNDVMSGMVGVIENMVVSQERIPERGNVTYNQVGKPQRIQENYGDFVVTTNFEYNNKGRLINWRTTKT